jgi:hypothetical protein
LRKPVTLISRPGFREFDNLRLCLNRIYGISGTNKMNTKHTFSGARVSGARGSRVDAPASPALSQVGMEQEREVAY